MKTGIKALVSAIAVSSLFSFSVLAVPFQINFETNSGYLADGETVNSFTPSTRQNTTNTTANCAAGTTHATNNCHLTFSDASGLPNAYRSVDWGISTGTGQSGLDVESYNGTLIAGEDWINTGMITHNNRVIASGSWSLAAINLLSTFNIVDPMLGGESAVFGISFVETPNANCDPDIQITGVPCDDYFTISGIPLPISFEWDGNIYQIDFRLAAGVGFFLPDGNLLITGENTDNTLFIQARLQQVDVPEPMTLAILGLGLIGVGFSTRKRANLKAA